MEAYYPMLWDALGMFLFLGFELSALFILISYFVSLLQQYIPDSKIQAILSGKRGWGYFFAAALGAITSVCSGALVLGAAGLLHGHEATTHWLFHDILKLFGAEPVFRHVVIDGNRITAAGVTSGIDMALTLAGFLWGDDVAQGIQLRMEYAPQPPYRAGSPDTAPKNIVATMREQGIKTYAERWEAAVIAAKRLNYGP